jgi:hypothetical protein
VLDRIEQGLSKGVPPERIAAASGQLVEKLAAAKPLVDALTQGGVKSGPGAERDAAIASAARALEKSIPAEDVKEMGSAVRAKGAGLPLFTSAVDAATYFTGRGMSSKRIAAGPACGGDIPKGPTAWPDSLMPRCGEEPNRMMLLR